MADARQNDAHTITRDYHGQINAIFGCLAMPYCRKRILPIAACFSLICAQTSVGDENRATPVERIKAADGFRVELLYSVPMKQQGSWINLCADDRGRIFVSDQYGGLFCFPAPATDWPLDPRTIDKIPATIRAVNGMVWAFGALYVAVNDYEKQIPSGIYRVTDSDGDDQLDHAELLREFKGQGDHAVHALLPTPDGKGLYLICGNAAKPAEFSKSRVPPCLGEDHLLPDMPDPRLRQRDVLAPAGIIYRVSPDGKDFELVSSGFRNAFDAAVNNEGELFTFDSDDEGDMNLPWYRPARICHVVSGADWGWRNGAGKWPPFYPDTLPPVIDIGPGSPTGMTFGYGAKFPARYQNALFALDWSWGKLYAVHLQPHGASYRAEKEEFLSGVPLPLTDAIIHPVDGAMYFTIGGRKIQSGLYRVTYVGNEVTNSVVVKSAQDDRVQIRQQLESFHGVRDARAIVEAWPLLNHSDRFIRYAARTALEHQAIEGWSTLALEEKEPARQVEALLGLARAGGVDPKHRKSDDPSANTALGERILTALQAIDCNQLSFSQRLSFIRAIQITLIRFGQPNENLIQRLNNKLDPLFPAAEAELNWLLCETLSYLQSPTLAAKGVAYLSSAATQEEQIECARSLRMLQAGWTIETHTAYLRWLLKAASKYRGGASFDKYIEFIRNDAVANLSDEQKSALQAVLEEKPIRISPLEGLSSLFSGRPRTEWTLDDLSTAAEADNRQFEAANGRKMFAAAACFTCHRLGNQGGMSGPDLTTAGRRYSPRDFLVHVLNPSKEINEQYVPLVIATTEGEVIQGIVVNLQGDTIEVNTDVTDPSQRTKINRSTIVSMAPTIVSPMPNGLLSPLTKDEILDLVAYVLRGGTADDPSSR
jgi:putative heme-binding domain-containing protein